MAADHDIAAERSESSALLSWLRLLNRKYGVPNIPLIPKKYGDDAIEYMEKRVGRLRSELDGADYVPWRTELYLVIYARARNLGYSMNKLYSIALNQFDKRITTLKELNDQELRELHSVIMATER